MPTPEPKQRPAARVMVSARIGRPGLDAFRRAAARKGLRQSDAIRQALAEWTRRNS